MFRPLGDLVVCKIDQDRLSKLILLPVDFQLEGTDLYPYKFGHVRLIGKDVRDVKVGDKIILNQHNGQYMDLDGEELMIVHEKHIEGVLDAD